MNILISNDDSINAQGMLTLANVLSKEHNVLIVAPDGERSASGHAISIRKTIKYKKIDDINYAEAYSLSGTPADCVKFGVKFLAKKDIDIVISGINHGKNIGCDVLYSGTVSAAMEGLICGYNAVAVSYCGKSNYDFKYAAEFIIKNINIFYKYCNKNKILNVNFPECDTCEINGVKITPLGFIKYNEQYKKFGATEDEGYVLDPMPALKYEKTDDCDIYWNSRKYITITPLIPDLTDNKSLKHLDIKDISL